MTEPNPQEQDTDSGILKLIKPHLEEAIHVINNSKEYLVEIPHEFFIDSAVEDIDGLIARTSNTYARLARLAGLLHAAWKAAETNYDIAWSKAYKNSEGSNQKARETDANIACEKEAKKVSTYEALYRIIDRHTNAASVASESSRKIASNINEMLRGEIRGERGKPREKDYQ